MQSYRKTTWSWQRQREQQLTTHTRALHQAEMLSVELQEHRNSKCLVNEKNDVAFFPGTLRLIFDTIYEKPVKIFRK